MSRLCQLCLSPYRSEIGEAYKNGVPASRIYAKYAAKLNYTAKFESFQRLLIRHVKGKHKLDALLVPSPEDSAIKVTPATLEGFGQKMLELGSAKIENMKPEDVALKDVIQAQKLLLDSRKVKLSEDAFSAMMGKMFAPELDHGRVIEGEEVEE